MKKKQIIYSYTPLKIQLGNRIIKTIPKGNNFIINLTSDVQFTFIPKLVGRNRIEYILDRINNKKVMKIEK